MPGQIYWRSFYSVQSRSFLLLLLTVRWNAAPLETGYHMKWGFPGEGGGCQA